MKMLWGNLEGPAKLLVICVVIFLVSAGLCGMQWAIAMGPRSDSLGDLLIPLGIAEIVAMAGSGALAIILVVIIILRSIVGRGSDDPGGLFPGKDPQTLFPRDDSKKDDKQP